MQDLPLIFKGKAPNEWLILLFLFLYYIILIIYITLDSYIDLASLVLTFFKPQDP
jgi:hypothetical protein